MARYGLERAMREHRTELDGLVPLRSTWTLDAHNRHWLVFRTKAKVRHGAAGYDYRVLALSPGRVRRGRAVRTLRHAKMILGNSCRGATVGR